MAERRNGTRPDPVHKAQAQAEGVTLTGKVEFRGRVFRLGPCDGIAPMLDFAEAAAKGVDTDDPAGMAAMKEMIRGSFLLHPSCGTCEACMAEEYDACPDRDEGDFPAFWRLVKAVAATGDEVFEVVQAGVEQAMARPTPARSGSSSPARSTSANSKGHSSSLPEAFLKAEAAGDLIGVDDVLR